MGQKEQPWARLKALMPLQLRELVPSQPGDGMPVDGNTDSKRPKHVVLADTIALVKSLQIKVLQPPCTCVWGGLLMTSSRWTIQAQAHPAQGPWRRLAGCFDVSNTQVRDTPPQSQTVSVDADEVRSPDHGLEARDLIKRVQLDGQQAARCACFVRIGFRGSQTLTCPRNEALRRAPPSGCLSACSDRDSERSGSPPELPTVRLSSLLSAGP